MNEEKYIKQRMGGRQPFLVPDHYFDDFASKVMSQLPEQTTRERIATQPKKSHRIVALRTWMYSAACLVTILVCGTLYLQKEETKSPEVHTAENVADGFVDAAADYAMIDNADIYAYLQDN